MTQRNGNKSLKNNKKKIQKFVIPRMNISSQIWDYIIFEKDNFALAFYHHYTTKDINYIKKSFTQFLGLQSLYQYQ